MGQRERESGMPRVSLLCSITFTGGENGPDIFLPIKYV
jgi:hypothetical protein